MGERILNADGEWVETPAVAPGRPTDPVRAWWWVSLGLLVKLIALILGVLGATGCAVVGCFVVQTMADAVALGKVAGGIVTVALVLDAIGRLLCLAAPETEKRGLIIASVIFQALAVLGIILTWADQASSTLWALSGMASQLLSATLFVAFLQALAVSFRRPGLAGFASTVYGGLGVFGLLAALLALIALILYVLYIAAGIVTIIVPLAGLGAAVAVIASSVILLPIALVMLVVLLITYICYAVVLVGVRGALLTRLSEVHPWGLQGMNSLA